MKRALEKLGHKVHCVGLKSSLWPLKKAIGQHKPDFAFYLLEEFADESLLEPFPLEYLKEKGIPFTGSDPEGLILAKNKAAAKFILKSEGLPTPDFYIFRKEDKAAELSAKILPAIVKLNAEEASLGLRQSSVVRDPESLLKEVQRLRKDFELDVIIEEFIVGRELHLGVLLGSKPRFTALMETVLGHGRTALRRIATEKAKWDLDYRREKGIRLREPKDIPNKFEKKLQNLTLKACRALGVTGYARVDFRIEKNFKPYILEVNPNPDVGRGYEFSEGARKVGLDYLDLVQEIITVANVSRADLSRQ